MQRNVATLPHRVVITISGLLTGQFAVILISLELAQKGNGEDCYSVGKQALSSRPCRAASKTGRSIACTLLKSLVHSRTTDIVMFVDLSLKYFYLAPRFGPDFLRASRQYVSVKQSCRTYFNFSVVGKTECNAVSIMHGLECNFVGFIGGGAIERSGTGIFA